MKTLLVLLLSLTMLSVEAQPLKNWSIADKHFTAGAIIGATTFTLLDNKVNNAEMWCIVTALGAGIGKEILDHQLKHTGTFNQENTTAFENHIAGIFYTLNGSMCITVIYSFIKRKLSRCKTIDYIE